MPGRYVSAVLYLLQGSGGGRGGGGGIDKEEPPECDEANREVQHIISIMAASFGLITLRENMFSGIFLTGILRG